MKKKNNNIISVETGQFAYIELGHELISTGSGNSFLLNIDLKKSEIAVCFIIIVLKKIIQTLYDY